MAIVAIAWIFVVVLMAAAEATSPQGTLLGAFFTLLLYGALPLSIVLYLLGTPMRRRARYLAERAAEGTPGVSDGAGKRMENAGEAGAEQAGRGAPEGAAANQPSGFAGSAPADPDGGGVAAGDPVPAVRKEP